MSCVPCGSRVGRTLCGVRAGGQTCGGGCRGAGGACAPRASSAHPGRLSGRRTSSPPTVAEQWGACWGIPCTAEDRIRNSSAPALSTVHWSQQVTAPPARWPASCSGFSTHGLSQRCTGNETRRCWRATGPLTLDPSALKEPAAGECFGDPKLAFFFYGARQGAWILRPSQKRSWGSAWHCRSFFMEGWRLGSGSWEWRDTLNLGNGIK